MAILFHATVLSGFCRTQSGLGDGRLVNHVLEHGYRWVMRHEGHQNYWNAPLFHPATNVTAYTDVLLGAGPLYWVWRWTGCDPDTAFQLWMITVRTLNYVAAYWLLRRCFGVSGWAATCGAYLMTFTVGLRVACEHPQLAPMFYTWLAVGSLHRIFAGPLRPAERPRRVVFWIATFFACLALQAYTAYYPFYFFGLVLVGLLLSGVTQAPLRGKFLGLVARHWRAILVCGVAAAAALSVLGVQYLEVARLVGLRRFAGVNVPRWYSWLLVHHDSLAYGWMWRSIGLQNWQPAPQACGLGLLTTSVALVGLYRERRRPVVRLMLPALAAVIIMATMFGHFSLWRFAHAWLPGAGAIRAIGRIGMILVLPAALGCAFALDALRRRRYHVLSVMLPLLCLGEQVYRGPSVDKLAARQRVASVVRQIDPDKRAFFLAYEQPDDPAFTAQDAAWASLAAGVRTINGDYGNFPPTWRLRDYQERGVPDAAARQHLREALDDWIARQHLDASQVQLIVMAERHPRRHSGQTKSP